jgi:NTE family protein
MPRDVFLVPDVLVLAGGGVLGEAWMSGVLAGIEETAGVDFRDTESFVGTSAGSIICARLAAGRRPRRPRGVEHPEADATGGMADPGGDGSRPRPMRAAARTAARLGWAATAPLAPTAIAVGTRGGALARAALLSRAPSTGRTLDDLHSRVEHWGTRFDGRLRVCCVDRRSGRRVVFGAPGAPYAEPADAVVASCSIPWAFRPVTIGGREYVDGGVWSVTNLDVAPAWRDTRVLCLDPTAALGIALRSTRGLLRQGFRAAAAIEIQALRTRGAKVRHIGPAGDAAELMGRDFMDPGPAERVHAAGYRQGVAVGRGAA